MSALLDAVRQKYPQYADKSDDELAFAIGSKYPTYLDRDDAFREEFGVAQLRASAVRTPSTNLSKLQLSPIDKAKLQEVEATKAGLPLESYSESVPKSLNPDYDFTRATGGGTGLPLALLGKGLDKVAHLSAQIPFSPLNTLEAPIKKLSGYTPKEGESVIPPEALPLADPSEHGVIPELTRVLKGFTTEGGIITLPLAELKPVQAYFLAQSGAAIPANITEILQAETPGELKNALTKSGVNLGMGALMARGLTRTAPEAPMQGPLPTGAALQMPKGAKPLATIGDMLEAKGTPLPQAPVKPPSLPVAASEAPKPPQTPPVVESAPKASVAAKEALIVARIKEGLSPENVQVTVNKDPALPAASYVQVDETHPTEGNVFSSNPEQMKALGYDMPTTEELLKLPAGKYKLSDLKNKAAQPSTVRPSQSPETPNLVSSETPPPVKTEVVKAEIAPKGTESKSGIRRITLPDGRELEVKGSGYATYWRDVNDPSMVKGNLASPEFRKQIEAAEAIAPKEEKLQVGKEPISRGPGAATAGEPGTYSPIQHMADQLRTTAGESNPIDEQLNTLSKLKATGVDAKDAITRTAAKTKAVADAMWQKWKGLPEYGDEQRTVGKWFRALQQADHEARNFSKEVIREVPSKLRREAITNWIQADGDAAVLQDRASQSTGTIRQGYEIASKLSPRETEIAQMLRQYYDVQLERGLGEGIIKEGLENYITQVWKKENPITKKLISELSGSKLQPNFKFARKRLFDSYFEGEQAGYIPNKDAGFLVANYDQQFNRTLAARAFIKDLHEGTASDGRPLVELSGNGKAIDDPKGAVLVKPKAKPEDLADYRTIDHPALRGWKWATKTPEGKGVFVQGDMLVHPEVYQKLKNRLSVSAFRQHPVTRTLLNVQTGIKQTMLSVSGFHQVQETLHALGHRVNPMNLPEIDFSEPTTKALAEHGLQLADYDALSSFSEGLAGGGLMNKIPGIGPKLHAYNEWLFQDYIPRLKLEMAKHALERNRERYPTLSEDKLLEQTASQANAAFGELPYKYWGRNPTLQGCLTHIHSRPDFLEARARFVGRAVRPHGREQLIALGLLAMTQYMTARITNQVLDKDPHWELKNAFRIIVGKHAYGLRSIPGDMLHLFSDTRGFFYNRMSPLLRTATEYITGRDDKGVKKDLMEQVKDAAKMPLPISMKPRAGQKWWEAFLNAFGVQEQRWDAVQTIQSKASEYKKSHNITSPVDIVYDREKDQYANLRTAIENSDEKDR
jgi:hypothetical protein